MRTEKLGREINIVGDDLFVTNKKELQKCSVPFGRSIMACSFMISVLADCKVGNCVDSWFKNFNSSWEISILFSIILE